MTSATVVSIGQSSRLEPLELKDIGQRLTSAIRQHEESITNELGEVLSSSSPLLTVPKPIQDEFKNWDARLRTPEEHQAAKAIRDKIVEIYGENAAHIQDKVRNNISRVQIDLAIKAISKTMSGVQQILSSQ